MLRPLTDKQIEYARLRVTMEPVAAYEAAGYSMKTAVDWQVKGLEGNRQIQDKIDELSGRPPRVWPTEADNPVFEKRKKVRAAVKVVKEALEVRGVVTTDGPKVRIGKVNSEMLEQKLWDLHESAIATKDLATARQCLVDIGKNKGMFTPTQKIRVERVEDLSDEQLEAMTKKFLADAVIPAVAPEEDGTTGQLVN